MKRNSSWIFSNRFSPVYSKTEDGGDTGGGSGDGENGNEIDLSSPEVKSAIASEVAKQVTGLKNKNDELLGRQRELKDQLSKFEGMDADNIKKILAQFESDEEAKLIADGNYDEVISRRMGRFTADKEREVDEWKTKAEKAIAFADKFKSTVLADQVKDAALGAGGSAEALKGFELMAKEVFKINDDGEAVAMDGDQVLYGKDGKNPLSLNEWAESLREKAPYLFPKGSGSGAQGGGAGGSTKSYSDCKTKEEKAEWLKAKYSNK